MNPASDDHALFATCPKSLEYLLRDELTALGASDAHEARAGVHFRGDLRTALSACLWSRLASRILWPLSEFEAQTDAALYAGVRGVDWSAHLAAEGTLAVNVTQAGGSKGHSQFLAQRVKDAVVDQFRERGEAVPRVDKKRPDIRLQLHVRRGQARLALDLAGTPLHQRGWRGAQGASPLKENLAAAMLLRAGWPECHQQGGALVDPMCGSGSLLIEGIWMAADVAPGLQRDYFGFQGWLGHDPAMWSDLRERAEQRASDGLRALDARFFGRDADARMVQAATHNAQRAGVSGFVHLDAGDIEHLQAPAATNNGLVITNPPYGERVGDQGALPVLYEQLGATLRAQFAGWRAAVLVADTELGHVMPLRSHKQYALYNGSLATHLLLFDIPAQTSPAREPAALSDSARMLANRLRKNQRHMRKRLQREDIHCWRAYDRDIPEYAAAIDVYTTTADVRYLHVQEYRAPKDIAENTARKHVRELLRVADEVFDVPRSRISLKQRRRGKGGARYGRFDQRGEWITVAEGGLQFRVNLFDYLDTGLFPDHRRVRARIRELATGRHCLNLFAYTAAASVYAAAGDALSTTSVDLSATYLDWASRNLAENGFAGRAHRLVQADARTFLEQDGARYGLIFVDPPTFSNSKDLSDFEVQRDHVALLQACAAHLEPDGVIVFSNNFKQFKLDHEALSSLFEITDESAASIPFDYARHRDIHGCWSLRLN